MMSSGLEQLFMLISVLLVMLGLGATQTLGQWRAVLGAPRALLIGMLCQFGIMPALAFSFAKAFDMPGPMALGLVLLGCSPGGMTSNILTYFAKGNVGLSVAMTMASTMVAIVAMPALLWVYARPFVDATLRIPYGQLTVVLITMAVPIAVGIGCKHHSPAWAARLERLGGLTGLLVLAYIILSWFPANGYLLGEMAISHSLACLFMSVGGFGLGFALSRFGGLNGRDGRTVAIETGMQNGTLTIAIIVLSFAEQARGQMLWPPLIYGIFVTLTGLVVTLWFRRLNQAPQAGPAFPTV